MSDTSITIGMPNNKYLSNEHYHEAGFDAYITGKYIHFSKFLPRLLLCKNAGIFDKGRNGML
jgi:hypothetical protein